MAGARTLPLEREGVFVRFASRWYPRGRVRVLPVFAGFLVVCGCFGESGEEAGSPLGIEDLAPPTGEGSGEPHLSISEDGAILSWLEPQQGDLHALKMSRFGEAGWSSPVTVVARSDLFVNWADFPSVESVGHGILAAHWLQRGAAGGYDYGVRIATSSDDGVTWSAPWTPHEDGTATEHGFVSMFRTGEGGWGLVWLDGRNYAERDGSPATSEMTLRFRQVSASGAPGAEIGVDGRICDCCQTDAATTGRGVVVAYRDRTEDEIRDISVVRLADGHWTEAVPVHDDGWHMTVCPVNGPAVAARDELVALAWFTGAGDVPVAKLAFSSDGGATFGAPVVVDDGNPAGRVDVELSREGAQVTWLERTGQGGAEVRTRHVKPDGTRGSAITLSASSSDRASGFPQMVGLVDGSLIFAWTDVLSGRSRVRAVRLRTQGVG